MTQKQQIHPNPRDSIGLLQTLSKALHHLLHQGLGDKKSVKSSSQVESRIKSRHLHGSHIHDLEPGQVKGAILEMSSTVKSCQDHNHGGTTTTEPPPATASRFLAFKRNWFITFKIVNMATLVFPLPVGAHTWSNSLRFPQNTPTKRTIGNLRTARCFLLKLRTNIFSVCSSKAHLYTSGRVSDWSCSLVQSSNVCPFRKCCCALLCTVLSLVAPGKASWHQVGNLDLGIGATKRHQSFEAHHSFHKVTVSTVSTVSRHPTKESNPQGSHLDA